MKVLGQIPSRQSAVAVPIRIGPAATGAEDDDRIVHALSRWTFGATERLVERVRLEGLESYLERQLRADLLPDPVAAAKLAGFETLSLPATAIRKGYAGDPGVPRRELQAAALVRAVYSESQLRERMVELWSDHLNVDLGDPLAAFLKPVDDREVIRPHALGRFVDLLLASARSPAMLYYLDQFLSTGDDPNENYARELLELHAVGADAGYTEEDVRNTALLLTGWSFEQSSLRFAYLPERHYAGPLPEIFGWRPLRADGVTGEADGVDFLAYLARHPATAMRLARKLCVRFVTDEPSGDLAAAVAEAYLAADTAIVPTLRALFGHPEFWKAAGQKMRRPFDAVAALLRAAEAELDLLGGGIVEGLASTALADDLPFFAEGKDRTALHLARLLEGMGQAPFRWGPPDGYPDRAAAWTSSAGILARWNATLDCCLDRVPGVRIDHLILAGIPEPGSAGELVDRVARRFLLRAATDDERHALLGYVGAGEDEPVEPKRLEVTVRHLAALVTASPAFQAR